MSIDHCAMPVQPLIIRMGQLGPQVTKRARTGSEAQPAPLGLCGPLAPGDLSVSQVRGFATSFRAVFKRDGLTDAQVLQSIVVCQSPDVAVETTEGYSATLHGVYPLTTSTLTKSADPKSRFSVAADSPVVLRPCVRALWPEDGLPYPADVVMVFRRVHSDATVGATQYLLLQYHEVCGVTVTWVTLGGSWPLNWLFVVLHGFTRLWIAQVAGLEDAQQFSPSKMTYLGERYYITSASQGKCVVGVTPVVPWLGKVRGILPRGPPKVIVPDSLTSTAAVEVTRVLAFTLDGIIPCG